VAKKLSSQGPRTDVVRASLEPLVSNFQDVSGPIVIPNTGDVVTGVVDPARWPNSVRQFYRVRLAP
jgi:hypothetical protein